MIPKTIHYCWFGRKPLPKLAQACIASWKKYLPDYKIIEWNEDTFDIYSNEYTKSAYLQGKYAYVTDYIRLYALYEHGGIYMDTDVEVLKSLDVFLHHPAFSGFERENTVPTGIMASEKGGVWVKTLLGLYKDKKFDINEGTNVVLITEAMKSWGIVLDNSYQELRNQVVFYPNDYFCPMGPCGRKLRLTQNSHTIHHFAGSWLPLKTKIRIKIMKMLPDSIESFCRKIGRIIYRIK
ncbi:MAG: glycosyltransferase [Akkermansia sp.]|nr:glycosyltransferase [Akkermansia sp.]